MKALVILSGGPDSVCVAYWAKSQGFDVLGLTFNYGQKAQIEIDSVTSITVELGIDHLVIDLSNLSILYKGATRLIDNNIKVSEEFTDQIVVPFRNGVFMAVAVAYATYVEADYIFYGAHGGDERFILIVGRLFIKPLS